MPEKWTGDIIGRMHVNKISVERLAAELGMHRGYVSSVLHSRRTPKDAKEKFNAALDRIIENQ